LSDQTIRNPHDLERYLEQARFEREVQMLGQLKHPNIVAIHDSGQAAGGHYFVMDYISRQSLDVWIAGAAPSMEDTRKLFAKICSAVNAAHLRGITHRDLKPGNVRVDENGEPHVLDCGVDLDQEHGRAAHRLEGRARRGFASTGLAAWERATQRGVPLV
jgi:serine/threonine protein kinase